MLFWKAAEISQAGGPDGARAGSCGGGVGAGRRGTAAAIAGRGEGALPGPMNIPIRIPAARRRRGTTTTLVRRLRGRFAVFRVGGAMGAGPGLDRDDGRKTMEFNCCG